VWLTHGQCQNCRSPRAILRSSWRSRRALQCPCPDNTALGRNSQNISVNGARVTQNDFELNGVDANNLATNAAASVAVPAPESIQEFKVQTSLYPSTFGRAAGGNVQAVTRSGGNYFHGAAYEYFRNDALNANNPFLKAAGVSVQCYSATFSAD
jgi:hypothetical protein